MSRPMKAAFIGLGNMGAAIAANLLKTQHSLSVWNRTAARADGLVAAGAVLAKSAAEAGAAGDVVFSMLADDSALDEVLSGDQGLLAGMRPGCLHVSMSTIAVATADRVEVLHRERGLRFACAPVFGRPEAAIAAKLFVVAAGSSDALQIAQPFFAALSQRVFLVGAKPSDANLIKLCGNFVILSAIEAMAEAMALAEKGGIARQQLLDVLTNTLFDTPVYRNYGSMLTKQRYEPAGFAAPLGLKDIRLTAQSAESLRVPMPLLSVLRDHLLQTIAVEGQDIDWSGIGLTVAKNSGLAHDASK